MALNHSPKIVTDGLVFYYDMANQRKSWKGGPTTNYHWNNGSPPVPWTVDGVNTNITGTSQDDAPIQGAQTWKFTKTGTSNQWNGWEGIYGGTWTGSSGDIWTTSYWYKTVSPAGLTGFNVGAFFTPDWVRPYAYTILDNVSSIIPDGKWHYNYTVTRIDEAYTNAIIVDGPAWGYSTSAGTLYLNGLQWTKTSYASPPYSYPFGTRSNTQSIVDLTGNNTVTANSLTYSYNGETFSFNGTNNYITAPSLGTFSNYTIDLWVKMNSLSGQQRLFSTPGGGTFTIRWTGSDFDFHYNPSDGSPPSTVTSATGLSYNTSTYYNLVATNSVSNGAKFYVNGELRGTGEKAIDLTGGCYFGADQTLSLWANCILPIAKIYSRELTELEIKQNFNSLRGRYGL